MALASLVTPTCADDYLVWETAGTQVDLAFFNVREQGQLLAQVPASPTGQHGVLLGCREVPTTFCVTPVDRAGLTGPERCLTWVRDSTWDELEDPRLCSASAILCCEGKLGQRVDVCKTRIVTDDQNPDSPCCATPIGGREVWP